MHVNIIFLNFSKGRLNWHYKSDINYLHERHSFDSYQPVRCSFVEISQGDYLSVESGVHDKISRSAGMH